MQVLKPVYVVKNAAIEEGVLNCFNTPSFVLHIYSISQGAFSSHL